MLGQASSEAWKSVCEYNITLLVRLSSGQVKLCSVDWLENVLFIFLGESFDDDFEREGAHT
jgi:hypothetical protein